MGVSQRNVWVLAIALDLGCMRANDTVLQPDAPTGTAAGPSIASSGRGAVPTATAGMGAAVSSGQGAAAHSGSTATAGGTTEVVAGRSGGVAGSAVGVAGAAVASAGTGAAGESSGVAGAPVATAGDGAAGEAGMGGAPAPVGATHADCDFNGIWIAKQLTVSEALGLPQTSNNWFYLEIKQTGDNAQVTKHLDCGIEVRGSATVTTSRATIMGSFAHNSQVGRKITVSKAGSVCSFEAARFWSVRGADEPRFVPNEARDSSDSIAQVAAAKPLPSAKNPDGALDIENDGKLGIAYQLTGILSGTRNSVQRDWSRWFTEPGYEIAANAQWTGDFKIRADFDNEENILDPTSGLLASTSAPKAGAKHALKLRFLGRDASDPRVAAIVKAADIDTCYAIQDALPAEAIE